MKLFKSKEWKKLNSDFNKWYKLNHSGWKAQKRWLTKRLIVDKFIDENKIPDMWVIFHTLTKNCSSWKAQNKILNLICLCLNNEIGEFLTDYVK